MAPDALAPYIARTSAATILTIYIICKSFSYLRNDFKYLCQSIVDEWHKCKYMFMFPLKDLARKGLRQSHEYSMGAQPIPSCRYLWYQILACHIICIESMMYETLIFIIHEKRFLIHEKRFPLSVFSLCFLKISTAGSTSIHRFISQVDHQK